MSAHIVNYTVPEEAHLVKKPVIFNVKNNKNQKIGSFKVSTAGIFWKKTYGKKPSWKKWTWEHLDDKFKNKR